MEYDYFPSSTGHPPPPPPITSQHNSGLQHQLHPQQGMQMMHPPIHAPQNIRQAMPPGPPNHQQPLVHVGLNSPQIPLQQQPHQNYNQPQPPHPHAAPLSHPASPHLQQPPHNNHSPLAGPTPQQSPLTSQQHHMHPQSPHHHIGPPMHMQQQPQPQLNQLVRPSLGLTVVNHSQQPGVQQPIHIYQNSFSSAPPPPQSNFHPYPIHPPPNQQMSMNHGKPFVSNHPHMNMAIGRSSPFPSNLQTEFRVIEFNRRLQSRPKPRYPNSPLPNSGFYDDGLWWERFASEFFEDDATLTIHIHDDKPQDYTIGRTLIPRFFRTYFDGGVTDLSINLRNPKEIFSHPQLITLDCDQAFIVTNNILKLPNAPNQCVVVRTEGHLILEFVNDNMDLLSIKSWRFYTKSCREYIERSYAATCGLPTSYLGDPITKQGLTKSTFAYLKMCMIMEPMQDLMFQHRQTKVDPRSCLRNLLFDKFKYRSVEDTRIPATKRRKRKPSVAASATSNNKKTKVNVGNPNSVNGVLNNNMILSPPNFSLASQDVMVVGEPSMMSGDFGDDNERMITRLENTQYDPAVTTNSNADESNGLGTPIGTDNGRNNTLEHNIENHTNSPSLLQQRQQQMMSAGQVIPQQNQAELSSPPNSDQLHSQSQSQQQNQHSQQTSSMLSTMVQTQDKPGPGHVNQVEMIESANLQMDVIDELLQTPLNDREYGDLEQVNDEDLIREDLELRENPEEAKMSSITDSTNDSSSIEGNSIDLPSKLNSSRSPNASHLNPKCQSQGVENGNTLDRSNIVGTGLPLGRALGLATRVHLPAAMGTSRPLPPHPVLLRPR